MTGMTPGETGPYELPDPGSRQFVRDAAEAQRENRIHDLAKLSIRRVRELHHKIADLEGENERLKTGLAAFLDECEEGIADLAALRKLTR